MVFQAGCAVEAFEGANEHNNTNKDGSNPDWTVELENFHRTAFNNLNVSNNPSLVKFESYRRVRAIARNPESRTTMKV